MSVDEKLTIETPELIPLEFQVAGIGSRFLALAIDTLFQTLVSLALLLPAAFIWTAVRGAGASSQWVLAVVTLILFTVQYAYFAGFEAMWDGQTPGKRRMRLRVIKETGRPITVYEALTRNLVRLVDQLPGIYAVGIVTALLNRQSRRLGDYAAGTVVVYERAPADREREDWAPSSTGTPVPNLHLAARLSVQELDVVEAYLMRRGSLPDEVRGEIARQIARRVAAHLEISEDQWVDPDRLIETVASERRGRRG